MSTSQATLRTRVIEKLGWGHLTGRAPTSNGAAGGTTVVDTTLGYAHFGDDFFNGWWCILPLGIAGAATYQAKQVQDFAGGDGAGTITVAAFSGQVTTAAIYELGPYDPVLIRTALNGAMRTRFPDLALPRIDYLYVDSLLSNGGFETYSSGFTGWTDIGSPTVTQETSRKAHGTSSAKIVASGATEGVEQNIFTAANVRNLVGKTLSVRGWVWASAASAVRLRVTFDGSTYENGPWHGGDEEWEDDSEQFIDVTVPAGATEMTVSCEVTDGNTGYFDNVRAFITNDRLYRYTIPSGMVRGPFAVSVSRKLDEPNGIYDPIGHWHEEEDSGGRYMVLDRPLIAGHIMRLDGFGLLTALTSTDTAATELDSPRTDLLVAEATLWLLTSQSRAVLWQSQDYDRIIRDLKDEIRELEKQPGMLFREHGVPINFNTGWIEGR